MIRSKILKSLNKLLPAPVHPFNTQSERTYAEWQYEKGAETIKFYLESYSLDEMFAEKTVVDIGCGAAGKSLYYASCGAEKVIGVEILGKYKEEAEALAKKKNLSEKFEFVTGDAANLPFADSTIDTIIMNDAMEHVDEPEAVLNEILRVLKNGGKAYINFPPYHHPFGAHLSDAIYIPWVHLFFSDKVLIDSYKSLVMDLDDGADRIEFRISAKPDGTEYFSYINHMTIKRFKRILNNLNLKPSYYREVPLRSFFKPLAHIPGIKELFVKMCVCVIEK